MPISSKKITVFTFFKLPVVYWMGIRVKSITEESCIVTVKHRWINQNPFRSLFWAVQGMAAELSTGALVMSYIKESGLPISMLLVSTKASFVKKATGRITFTCRDGNTIKKLIEKSISSQEGQTCWMKAEAIDNKGDVVSVFDFEWSVKLRK